MNKGKSIIRKVLVVDDNEVNSLVLSKMLELFGIDTDKAYSGKDAVKMAEKKEYEIIFIDHFMPDMDGVETTKLLRTILKDKYRTAIFALTSDVSNVIIAMYCEAGANDVYEKPLGASELYAILKQYLSSPISEVLVISDSAATLTHKELIKTIVNEIGGLNYNIGLKYAGGASRHYIYIIKVALKDIMSSMERIRKSSIDGDLEALQIEIHNLKSVFSNIGAVELLRETLRMETVLKQYNLCTRDLYLIDYIHEIEAFNVKLRNGLEKYEKSKPAPEERQNSDLCTMTEEEYEQSLLKTIYYIKIFDYVSIVSELERLIHNGNPKFKKELKKMLEDIREFKYDNAMEKIMRIIDD
jgi:CheY-like chemotaxis protein